MVANSHMLSLSMLNVAGVEELSNFSLFKYKFI